MVVRGEQFNNLINNHMEKEITNKELKSFMRAKAGDTSVLEKVEEVDKDEEIARLKQYIIDDQAEIDRRTAHKAIAEAELAIYDK